MADEKAVDNKKLNEQVEATKKELAEKASKYTDTVVNLAEEFGNDTKEAYEKVRAKVDELGKDFESSDFGKHVKDGYDDIKDKILSFFHNFDKKDAEKDVKDIKTKIDQTKEKVDDSEAGKAASQHMDELKGQLDTLATNVTASDKK